MVSKMLKTQSMTFIPARNAHTPMIKFLGKRDLIKSGGGAAAGAGGQVTQAASTSGKPLSPDCTLNFDTHHEAYARRIAITDEECDIINAGGNDVPDWTKITL